MAEIGQPDRWWYEPDDNPLDIPVPQVEPAPSVEPAPTPEPVAP